MLSPFIFKSKHMGKIVLVERQAQTVMLSDIMRSKTYVYTGASGGVWVLSKLGRYTSKNADEDNEVKQGIYHYGFIRVDKTDEVQTFTALNDYEVILKAVNAGRKVLEFDTFTDFMKWKLKVK